MIPKSGTGFRKDHAKNLAMIAWSSVSTTDCRPTAPTPGGVGGIARRHADDPDAGRGQPAALAARPPRHEGGRGHLSAAVAAVVALCRGDPAPAPGAAALPRQRGRQDALRHRRRRLGCGRQVDHRARAAGAAGALDQCAEGRPDHHRRVPAAERGAGARRPDGEEGLSGELRPAGAAGVSLRRKGRPASGACAGLFASDLRRDAEPVGRDRPAGHPDRRRAQRAADRAPAQGRQGDPVRVGLLRLLGLSRRRRGSAEDAGTSIAS